MHNPGVLEDLMKVIENKFLATNVAAKRARWLNDKKRLPTIKTDAFKSTTIALEELLENKLNYQAAQYEEPEEIDEAPPALDTSDEREIEEDSDSLFDEEYIDDSKIVADDEEPEEGI